MSPEQPSAYGLWTLVVINSLVFIIFAFSFATPKTGRDWRSFGAFSAFLVALFTEIMDLCQMGPRHWAGNGQHNPLSALRCERLHSTKWRTNLCRRPVATVATELGIGLAPLLQWLLVPPLVLLIVRRAGTLIAPRWGNQ